MDHCYSKGFVYKHRGKWYAAVSYQDDDGKQKRISKSTGICCSPKEKDNRGKLHAEDYLRSWRDELVRQEAEAPPPPVATQPLYNYCQDYLGLHHVKATTRSGYRAAISHLPGTTLGNTPVGEVTADAVRAWENDMRINGLSETTIGHYHAFLAQVLKAAAAEGKIARNPLAAMKAPRRKPKPVNSLTGPQRAEVLAKMVNLGHAPLATAVRIALLTGMRRGEICALRWQDVDLEGRVVHVTHALTKDHGFVLDTPKDPSGGDSTRDIPIGRVLSAYLAEHREIHKGMLSVGNLSPLGQLFVIGDPLRGTFKNPDILGREWSMLSAAEGWVGTQGERPRFHDLRHTFATLAIKDRVMDVMSLSRIMGHKDAAMTLNIYSDALEEAKRAGMDALDATL